MIYPVVVPSLGATGGEIVLLEWLAEPGQFIAKGTPLFVVQTGKADMEVEAFREGYPHKIVVSTLRCPARLRLRRRTSRAYEVSLRPPEN
jgi:pyruvate/2-oxoglutarate dehydrogenase complex dihydrolipoamide acyltransferase (E2) component